jgi:hypothetical protein
VIVAEPVATPVTFPKPSTLTFPLLLVQLPPAVVSLIAIIPPKHSAVDPCIGNGLALINTIAVVIQPPSL